jgi:hypothetical protein
MEKPGGYLHAISRLRVPPVVDKINIHGYNLQDRDLFKSYPLNNEPRLPIPGQQAKFYPLDRAAPGWRLIFAQKSIGRG